MSQVCTITARGGSEKNVEQSLMADNEITFKIPLQDRVTVFIKDSPS